MIEDSKWGPHSIGIFFYADGSYILHTLVNICKSHVYVNRYQGLWARHWIGIPGISSPPTLSINDKKTIKSRKIGLQTKTEIRFVKQGLQKSTLEQKLGVKISERSKVKVVQ